MTVFDRLIGSEEPKIAVHPFYSSIMLYSRGLLTEQQFMDLNGLTADDMGVGTTIAAIFNASTSVVDPVANRQLGRDLWSMLCLAEHDEMNTTGLRVESSFETMLGLLVGMYDGS